LPLHGTSGMRLSNSQSEQASNAGRTRQHQCGSARLCPASVRTSRNLGRGFGAYTSVLLALAAWFLGSCSKPVTDSMSRAAEPEGSSATESASPKPTSEIATGDELPEVAAISQTGDRKSVV